MSIFVNTLNYIIYGMHCSLITSVRKTCNIHYKCKFYVRIYAFLDDVSAVC
jgi:hypothetical protein